MHKKILFSLKRKEKLLPFATRTEVHDVICHTLTLIQNSESRNLDQNGVYQSEAGKSGEMLIERHKLSLHSKNEIKRRKNSVYVTTII